MAVHLASLVPWSSLADLSSGFSSHRRTFLALRGLQPHLTVNPEVTAQVSTQARDNVTTLTTDATEGEE